MDNIYEGLKLENQLCFPLYAASKEIIKKYRPLLNKIDLTYTQYITMMVLWEEENITVKKLGIRLFLDSGTLTPLLKSLEIKGLIQRVRNKDDERELKIGLTKKGLNLKTDAAEIPSKIVKCVNISQDEAMFLYKILYKILGKA